MGCEVRDDEKIPSYNNALTLAAFYYRPSPVTRRSGRRTGALDEKVERFLNKMRSQWRDFNVPEEDGKILYETIVKNRYTKTLEIGTSTGHLAIWIAWALSKTGGKLSHHRNR